MIMRKNIKSYDNAKLGGKIQILGLPYRFRDLALRKCSGVYKRDICQKSKQKPHQDKSMA